MIKIYEAANGFEAKLILDLLINAGLNARIDGEYLQGGIGDLQASGLVRVMITEDDYTTGKGIINQWENNEFEISDSVDEIINDNQQKDDQSNGNNVIPSPNKILNYLTIGILGFLIGVISTNVYFKTPVSEIGIDHDGDGIPDEWYIYNGQYLSETRTDRNLDKSTDMNYYYDYRGMLESMKSDDNFDGIFESDSRFKNGNTQWSKVDTTGDGFKNYRMYFKYGVLNSIAHYDSQSKKIIKLDYFKNLKLSYSEKDTNNDGVLDTKVSYDQYENPISSIKL